MRSGNPALWDNVFQKSIEEGNNSGEKMTLQWSVNKAIFSVALTVLAAVWVWNYAALFIPYYIPIAILGFIIALVIIFKQTTAPYMTPVYALVEWVFIWAVSATFEAAYPGIVIQAAGITFAVFISMLGAYKSGLIQATENFKLWVVAATGWIALMYIISIIWSLTGLYSMSFLHDSSPLSIGISVFVVLIASLNLVLDFDFIENGVEAGAPKYMEWYGAFGLLVTLVWLYLEILRLLAKIKD